MQLDVGDMLATASATESTPPLFYLAERGWTAVFGTGPVGLRSLPALAGTLTIPVVYAAGAALASRRAGLLAAGLTAVCPPLVWYSQEARSYALVVLLSALTLMFLARALGGRGRLDLAGWGLSAVLAVATHYFAGFLVAAEAAWLLAAYAVRRDAVVAVAAAAVACALAFPLAVSQSGQGNLDWIGTAPLPDRVADAGELFLVGPTAGRLDYVVPVLLALVLLAAVTAGRADRSERAALAVPLTAAAVCLALPLVVAVLGADYVVPRNLLPALVPLLACAGIALGVRRAGALGVSVAAALAVAWLALVLAVPLDRSLQRGAITAALVPQPVDAERERVVPSVGYAQGERARASCPRGHTAVGGGGAVLAEGPDEMLGPQSARGDPAGWTAQPPPGASDRRVYVYAICVRPLD